MKELGAEILAVSADTPAEGRRLAADLNLTYPVVSDSSRKFIRLYGVLHPVEQIARPAVFIVSRERKIVWSYVGQGPTDRPQMDAILKELRPLAAK